MPTVDDSDEKHQTDVTYAWTDVSSGDGASMNANSDCDASDPVLHGLDGSLTVYAAWSEDCGSGAVHVRVARFNEDIGNPAWTFVDGGNPTQGINADSGDPYTSENAGHPVLAYLSATQDLYVSWAESVGAGLTREVRVKRYNVPGTAWAWADLGSHTHRWVAATEYGLNYNADMDAVGAPAIVAFQNKIIVSWAEKHPHTGVSQLRVAREDNALTCAAGQRCWTFVDGNRTQGLNIADGQAAGSPHLQVFNDTVFVTWVELNAEHEDTGHVRVALHEGETSANAVAALASEVELGLLGEDSSHIRPYHLGGWAIVDELTTGLNTNPLSEVEAPSLVTMAGFTDGNGVVFEERLFVMWAEISPDLLAPLREIYICQYNSGTSWVNLGNDLTDTVCDGVKYDGLNDGHAPKLAVLDNRLHLVHVDETPYSPQIRTQVFSVVSQTEAMAKHPAAWKPTSYTITLDSATPVYTEAKTSLPEPGAVNSLGFYKDIVIDTVVPFVEQVYFGESVRADGDEAFLWDFLEHTTARWTWDFPVSGDAATRIQERGYPRSPMTQTIDVRSSNGPFSSGSYRLTYGSHMTSVPIAYDADAATFEAALEGMIAGTDTAIWDVSVTKDDAPWLDGHTYTVVFVQPQYGVKLLKVDTLRCLADALCDAWKCQGDTVACTPAITVNADLHNDVLQSGVVDLVVKYSAPVRVAGTPTIALNSGGIASFTRGGVRQVIDVNVGANAPEVGRFKLQYGTGDVTGCIDWDAADTINAFSLKSRLLEIDAINVIGCQSITGVPLRNGYRFTVVFDTGIPAALTPVDASACADVGQGIAAFQPDTHVAVPDTDELYFRYVIGASDAADYLAPDPSDLNIVLANAAADTIIRSTNNAITQAALLALPAWVYLTKVETVPLPVLPSYLLAIDTATRPTVVGVSSPLPSGTYFPGDEIPVVVEFDTAVFVEATLSPSDRPVLWMRAGQYVLQGGTAAVFHGGSGSTNLTFTYTVRPEDDALELDTHSIYSLDRNGVEITSLVNGTFNPHKWGRDSLVYADLTLPSPNGVLSVDGGPMLLSSAAPEVVKVRADSFPRSGHTYHTGEVIDFLVKMDSDVVVGGNPRLYLNTVTASSSPWTQYATFGRRQVLDVGAGAASQVTSGQFRLAYGESHVTGCIDWDSADSMKARLLEVPEIAALGIMSVTAAAEGHGTRFVVRFFSGEPLPLLYSYRTEADRLCYPFLPPLSGADGQTLTALVHNSPADLATEMWFTYTVSAGDGTDAVVPGDATALWLPHGGYVRQLSDNPGTDADLTLSSAALDFMQDIPIDSAMPTVVDVLTTTGDGPFGTADTVVIHVEFSTNVTVMGAPTLEMHTSGVADSATRLSGDGLTTYTNGVATYEGGSATTTLEFSYTVRPGDLADDFDYFGTEALAVSTDGWIRATSDTPTTDADLTLPTVASGNSISGDEAITIDTESVGSRIIRIDTPLPDAEYGCGHEIPIEVTFSKPVMVTTGLNFDDFKLVRSPFLHSLPAGSFWDASLFATWTEKDAAGIHQVRLVRYNNDDINPEWTYLHTNAGDAANPSLNYDLAAEARNPSLCSTKGDLLAVVWEEKSVANGKTQIMMASYQVTGNSAGSWATPSFSPLNLAVDENAQNPVCVAAYKAGGSAAETTLVYLSWSESTTVTGARTKIVVLKEWNVGMVVVALVGSSARPEAWMSTTESTIDADNLGNWDQMKPSLLVYRNLLYLGWHERPSSKSLTANPNTHSEVGLSRIRVFERTSGGVWRSIDGSVTADTSTTKLKERDVALRVIDVEGSVYGDLLCTWTAAADDGVDQVVVATFDSDSAVPAWTFVAGDHDDSDDAHAHARRLHGGDGDGTSTLHSYSLNYDDGKRARYPQIVGVAGTIWAVWYESADREGVALPTDQIRARTFVKQRHGRKTTMSWEFVDGNGPAGLNLEPDYNARGLTATLHQDKLYLLWYEGNGLNDVVRSAVLREPLDYVKKFLLQPAVANVLQGWSSCTCVDDDEVRGPCTCSYPSGAGALPEDLDGSAKEGVSVPQTLSDNYSYFGRAADGWIILTSGNPLFTMDVGATGTPSYAIFYGTRGVLTTVLTFLYVVQDGDAAADLDIDGTYNGGEIDLNGGRIVDFFRQSATLDLNVGVTDVRSLPWHREVVVDTSAPTIVDVTSPLEDGKYGAGQMIFIELHFSKGVVVSSGVPTLKLGVTREGGGERVATYVSGSSTAVLTFRYDVEVGDFTPHLNYAGTLAMYDEILDASRRGETVTILRDSSNPTTPVNVQLPTTTTGHTLSHNSILHVDTSAPRVVGVSTEMPDGEYGLGSTLSFSIEFTQPVTIIRSDLCYVELQTHSEELGRARYLSGDNTPKLDFSYSVLEGHSSDRLDVKDTRNALVGLEISTALKCFPPCYILRAATHPVTKAALALHVPGKLHSLSHSSELVVDSRPPFVESVAVQGRDGVYGIGESIVLHVTFSAPVVVRGSPVLRLNIMNHDLNTPAPLRTFRYATYGGVSGSKTLTFAYTVVDGDSTNGEYLDYLDASALTLYRLDEVPESDDDASFIRVPATLTHNADLVLTPPSSRPITVLGPYSVTGSGSKVLVSTSQRVSNVFVVLNDEFGTDRVEPNVGPSGEYQEVVVGNGVKIHIGLGFVEPVTVDGTPELVLGVSAPADGPLVVPVENGTVALMAWCQNENGISRVRVAKLKSSVYSTGISFIEGSNPHSGTPNFNARINANSDENAGHPSIIEHHSGRVYIAWEEYQSKIENRPYLISGGATRVRVKQYNGDDASPEWKLVDGAGFLTNNAGHINNQHLPDLAEWAGDLYIGFHQQVGINYEVGATEGRVQHAVHVYAYNGEGNNPAWTVTGGGTACKCLNFDPTQDAREVQLVAYETGGSESTSYLYATWLEFSAAGGAYQVRVAVYEALQDKWTIIDQGGLNTDPRQVARHPRWIAATPVGHAPDASGRDNYLYLVWEEEDEACDGLPQIRIVTFNGKIRSPVWASLHGALPTSIPDVAFTQLCSNKFNVTYECQLPSILNRRPCIASKDPTGVSTAAGDLVLSWTESNGADDQLRVSVFGFIDSHTGGFNSSTHEEPEWTTVEGDENNFYGLNQEGHPGFHARKPTLAVVNDLVTAAWTEVGSGGQNVRVSEWNLGVYASDVDIPDTPGMEAIAWTPKNRYTAQYVHQETYRVFVRANPLPTEGFDALETHGHTEALDGFLGNATFTLRFGHAYLQDRFQANELCDKGSCHDELAAELPTITTAVMPVNVSASAMQTELNSLLSALGMASTVVVQRWDHTYQVGHYEGGIEHWEVFYEWKLTLCLHPGEDSDLGSDAQRRRILGVGDTAGGLLSEDLTVSASVGSGFEEGPQWNGFAYVEKPTFLMFEYEVQVGDGSSNGGQALFDYYGATALQVPPGTTLLDTVHHSPVSLALPKPSLGEDLVADLLDSPLFYCRDPHRFPNCRVEVTIVDDALRDVAHMMVRSNAVPDHLVQVPSDTTAPGNLPLEDQVDGLLLPAQPIEIRIPLNPKLDVVILEVPLGGVVGVALNGVPIVSYLDRFGHNTVAGEWAETVDSCDGFQRVQSIVGPQLLFGDELPSEMYSYRSLPICLGDFSTTQSVLGTPSPLIGYALDGFAIYGPYDEHGRLPVDLDRCNGRVNAKGNFQYHTTSTPPYTVGCFRGSLDGYSSAETPLAKSFPGGLYLNTDLGYVVSVSTAHADGFFGIGEEIVIDVQFSGDVTVVTPTAGVAPTLTIVTGAGLTKDISLQGGSGTSVLSFLYVVAAGDAPHGSTDLSKLRYDDPMALNLGTSSIHQKGGISSVDALLVLPRHVEKGSLAFSSAMYIDTAMVTIADVASPNADGLYSEGAQVVIVVTFSAPVDVTGNPTLQLDTSGLSDAYAECFPDVNVIQMVCHYQVRRGDSSSDLDYRSISSLVGDIKRHALPASVADIDFSLPPPGSQGSLGRNRDFVIRTGEPRVAVVTSVEYATQNGIYGGGATVEFDVVFSRPVTVVSHGDGIPTVDMVVKSPCPCPTAVVPDWGLPVTKKVNWYPYDAQAPGDFAFSPYPSPVPSPAPPPVEMPNATCVGDVRVSYIDEQTFGQSSFDALSIQWRHLQSAGIPEHLFGDATGHPVKVFAYDVLVPHLPKIAGFTSSFPAVLEGLVGFALDGVPFLNHNAGGSILGSRDVCDGFATADQRYHYVGAAACLLAKQQAVQGTTHPQLGWALDGFPIYPLDEADLRWRDACGGADLGDGLGYRYLVGTFAVETNTDGTVKTGGASSFASVATVSCFVGHDPVYVTVDAAPHGETCKANYDSVLASFVVPPVDNVCLEAGHTFGTASFVTGSATDRLRFAMEVPVDACTFMLEYRPHSLSQQFETYVGFGLTDALRTNGATIVDDAAQIAQLLLPPPFVATDADDRTFTVTIGLKDNSHPFYAEGSNHALLVDAANSPLLTLVRGVEYTFDQSHYSNQGRQLLLYLDADRTELYTESVFVAGIAGTAGARLRIRVPFDAPLDLFYQSSTEILEGGLITIPAVAQRPMLENPRLSVAGNPLSLAGSSRIALDTTIPHVVSVTTSTATGTYGVGEVIEIYVSFSHPVRVTGTPALMLKTNPPGSSTADKAATFDRYALPRHYDTGTSHCTYCEQSGLYPADYDDSFGSELVFRYVVTNEDQTPALDYKRACAVDEIEGDDDCVLGSALRVVGGSSAITRYGTSVGSETVDLTLPVPGVVHGFALLGGEIPRRLGSAASMSFNAQVELKGTIAPSVVNVTTTKVEPGYKADSDFAPDFKTLPTETDHKYVAGDVVDVLVTFTDPVVVTGVPRLRLDISGTDDARYAFYNPSDAVGPGGSVLPGSGQHLVSFLYTVQGGDLTTDLNYLSSSAIELNGGTIKRLSTASTTDAVLTLPTPSWATRLGRQLNMVQKVEIDVRGLYHHRASDLVIKLAHDERNVLLAHNACGKKTFGLPNDDSRPFLPARNPDGTGFDYAFADVDGDNLALTGVATQSSTLYDAQASRAIDGNTHGYFSHGSISHTAGHGASDPEPWWQVKLYEPDEIGTIKVFNRQQEPRRDEIQIITTTSSIPIISDSFTLTVSIADSRDSSLLSLDTGNIAHNAVARREDEDTSSDAPGTGKGESVQSKLEALLHLSQVRVVRSDASHVDGYTWTVTFSGSLGDVPQMSVAYDGIANEYPGGQTTTATLRDGNDNAWYKYRETLPELQDRLHSAWVMVFDEDASLEFATLADAKAAAVWKRRMDLHDTIILDGETNPEPLREFSFTLPYTEVVGQWVRIQLEEPAYLTLAEVQVYVEQNRPLSLYDGGSPVSALSHPGGFPYAPEQSFASTFMDLSASGFWHLWIYDTQADSEAAIDHHSPALNVGAISDWVLHITDTNGVRHSFYMDLVSTVKTLPKYGVLYASDMAGVGAYVGDEALIAPVMGETRHLSPCYGTHPLNEYYRCTHNFGVGNDLRNVKNINHRGDVAQDKSIRGDRVVYYQPFGSYLGPDEFTYEVRLGTEKSPRAGTVQISVKVCRGFDNCNSDLAPPFRYTQKYGVVRNDRIN
jgi:hypothetical protein